MGKGRIEAFSDGVIAIIITIMVLELKVPHGADFAALHHILPTFVSYVISFVFVGIYWNNHHHLLHLVKHVDARIMWANMHLLFWLSLIPVVTGWVGEYPYEAPPTALYGFVFFMSGIAYLLLQTAIVARHGRDSALARAVGSDLKGKASGLSYLAAIGLAFVNHWISVAIYVGIAILWFIPDRRIARTVHGPEPH
jgi:TMEM175 potassium channel family protein